MNDIGIIIPIYKLKLTENEERAFVNNLDKITTYPIIFLAPYSLDTSWYESKGDFKIQRFEDKYFRSDVTYTKLLLNPKFYKAFSEYIYILILQTDVWILQEDSVLSKFLAYQYDYIGAPWKQGINAYAYTFKGIAHFPKFISRSRTVYVGNGGLSLRKVESQIALLKKYWLRRRLWRKVGEDIFFAYYGQRDVAYSIAPIEIAEIFSLETSAKEDIQSGVLPFGIHAWEKYYPEIAGE